MIKKIQNKEIGRTNLYKIYLLLREYKELEKERSEKKYMFYPFFYYFLSRNIKEEHRADVQKLFIDVNNNYEVRERALFVAKYILMKTREVRS
jgi:uncharacterized LabA/DUF88 family protein